MMIWRLAFLFVSFVLFCPLGFGESDHKYSPDNWESSRQRMVNTLTKYRSGVTRVTHQDVIDAMLKVPRHLFVPESQQRRAYDDAPLPIGFGQTISQPYIVALMTQLADVERGMSVLEIGTGSGYQAAILSELTHNVFTMEIIQPLAKRVGRLFQKLNLKNVMAVEGDGYYGWPDPRSFDRIVVTAAAAHIPPPLLKQLKPTGKMVIPIGPRWGNQELLLVEKDKNGKSRTRSILPVRFVPFTGGRNE